MRSLAKEYGVIRNDYGIAASPVAADGLVLVQIDHLEGSYLLAADAATGKTKWKTARTGVYDNWATPVVATVGGAKQVVCLGTKTVAGYDLATGKQEWSLDGLERLCSCTPVVRDNTLYAVSGPSGATLAIDLAATPTPKVVWQSRKNGPFVPSAVVVGDLYFFTDDQGNASCLGPEDRRGEVAGAGRQRSDAGVAGGGRGERVLHRPRRDDDGREGGGRVRGGGHEPARRRGRGVGVPEPRVRLRSGRQAPLVPR
jgi:hypothetical protein